MSDTMTLRVAEPEDLPAIDLLLSRSYPALLRPAYPPSVMVTAVPMISRAQPRLVASGTYYLVERDGVVLGAGGWTRARPGDWQRATPKVAHVRHVVTDHRQVRQGVGQRLMQHVLAEASAAGVRRLECYSTFVAEPFYAALGFRVIGPVSVDLAPGVVFPAIHMRRDLRDG